MYLRYHKFHVGVAVKFRFLSPETDFDMYISSMLKLQLSILSSSTNRLPFVHSFNVEVAVKYLVFFHKPTSICTFVLRLPYVVGCLIPCIPGVSVCQSIPWLPLIVGWGSCRDDTSTYLSTSQWGFRFNRTSSWNNVLYGRWYHHVIAYLSFSWYILKSALSVLGVLICLFLLFWYLTLEYFSDSVVYVAFHFYWRHVVVKRTYKDVPKEAQKLVLHILL